MKNVSAVLGSLEFSDKEISARTNISIDRIHEIISGSVVSHSELRALSRGLKIPLKTFAIGATRARRSDELGILFRNTILEKTEGQEGAIEAVGALVEGALELLPKRNHPPEWLLKYRVKEENYIEASRLAALFRREFFRENLIGPAIELPQVLCDTAGLIISRLRHSRYEGASVIAGGYCFIFVSPRFPARMLFTIAHELGHIVAHHVDGQIAVFDKPTQIGATKRKIKTEAFADAFASNLLLPDQGIGLTLKTIREMYKIEAEEIGDIELLVLARMYGVSFEVAAHRCEDLELLPIGGARSIYEHLRKHHKSPEKRAAQLDLPERNVPYIPNISPNLLNLVVEKINAGEVSLGWASDRLGLSIDEIYSWHAQVGDNELPH